MKKLILANWKMNLGVAASRRLARSLVDLQSPLEVGLCPSTESLSEVKRIIGKRLRLGAQNCSHETSGAHTGETSAVSLRELGCVYVIIGHSERRALGEDCVLINKKLQAALDAGLTPVLCVGETAAQNKDNRGLVVIRGQLQRALRGLKLGRQCLLIAYEPLWAIGSGHPAAVKAAEDRQSAIKEMARRILGLARPPRVLYGGSVSAKNAVAFLREPDIDGLLVGGASLQASEFKKIANFK